MSVKTMRQLREDAKRSLLEAKSVFDKGDDATPEELEQAIASRDSAKSILDRMQQYADSNENLKSVEGLTSALASFGRLNRPHMGHDGPYPGNDGATLPGGNGNGGGSTKSLGRAFVENEGYQDWVKSVLRSGDNVAERRIESPIVEVKTLYTSAGDATAGRPMLGQADRQQEIVRLGWAPLVLRQLVTTIPTQSDLIEVIRELSRDNNADFVAEATATSGSSGLYPESAVEYEMVTTPVQNVGHFIPTSTRAMADGRRMAMEIDTFLREGVDDRTEQVALQGDGNSNHFLGIYNTQNILTQAYSTSVLATTRKARTKLKVTGRVQPTAWLMHPNDWEAIDLIQDGQQRYYFGGPLEMGTPRLWGQPVVESEYATEGLPILARWTDAVYYDREQTNVMISNQHMDFFIRGMLLVLADARMAFHVRRPASFCTADITS